MKTTLLLATTLFLVSAPAPDSRDIAEMTSNFIILDEVPGLMAAEEAASPNRDLGLRPLIAPTNEQNVGATLASRNAALNALKEQEKEPTETAGPDKE